MLKYIYNAVCICNLDNRKRGEIVEFKFKTGEYVRYSINGVCLVEDIRKMDIMGDGNEKMFYVLSPNSRQASTICVPVDNDILTAKMVPPLSREDIEVLIDGIPTNEMEWIDDKKKRTEFFKNIIKECDRQSLLSLIDCLYKRRASLLESGKNLSSGDEAFLNQAEGVIQDEFSFVLEIGKESVSDYVKHRLSK